MREFKDDSFVVSISETTSTKNYDAVRFYVLISSKN